MNRVREQGCVQFKPIKKKKTVALFAVYSSINVQFTRFFFLWCLLYSNTLVAFILVCQSKGKPKIK